MKEEVTTLEREKMAAENREVPTTSTFPTAFENSPIISTKLRNASVVQTRKSRIQNTQCRLQLPSQDLQLSLTSSDHPVRRQGKSQSSTAGLIAHEVESERSRPDARLKYREYQSRK